MLLSWKGAGHGTQDWTRGSAAAPADLVHRHPARLQGQRPLRRPPPRVSVLSLLLSLLTFFLFSSGLFSCDSVTSFILVYVVISLLFSKQVKTVNKHALLCRTVRARCTAVRPRTLRPLTPSRCSCCPCTPWRCRSRSSSEAAPTFGLTSEPTTWCRHTMDSSPLIFVFFSSLLFFSSFFFSFFSGDLFFCFLLSCLISCFCSWVVRCSQSFHGSPISLSLSVERDEHGAKSLLRLSSNVRAAQPAARGYPCPTISMTFNTVNLDFFCKQLNFSSLLLNAII